MKSVAPQTSRSFFNAVGTRMSSIFPIFLQTNSFSVTGSCLIPKRVCTLAPARSASTRMTSYPSRARAQAVFTATRLLPTPPFPPPTAQMTPLMSLMESMVIPERIADKKRWSAQQSSTPPACDLVKLLCETKRQVTGQECDHLVAIARYAYRPPSANIREASVHNAVRGKPKPSGKSRHIHLRPLVELGTHEPGTQGGGDNTRPGQSIR